MSITSYAQNFEDVMLWRALGHIPNGFYIDVGAQHPVIDSVSKAFYEHGWRGLHVEATPVYATLVRADRPDELVLQVALSDKPGSLTFYEIPDTGLSTGDKSIAEKHQAQGFAVRETTVPCITLADVFAQAGQREIHWLKIDVEGMEPQVLAGWGDSAARPWVLVVESTYPNSQIETHAAWQAMVLDRGYREVHFDGLSRFYVVAERTDIAERFNAPPNIFDGFALASTAPYNAPIRALIKQTEQQHKNALAHETELHEALLLRKEEQLVTTTNKLAEAQAQALELTRSKSEIAAQLLAIQQQSAKEAAELAHRHGEQASALQIQYAEREQSLHQKLQAQQEQLNRLQQERAAREQALHEQNSQSRQELESVLRQLAQREQQVAAQLLKAQQQAEQEKAALAHRHGEQASALQHQYAEREQTLHQKLQAQQEQLNRLAVQHLATQQQVAREKSELVRQYANKERELNSQIDLREKSLAEQLKSHRNEIRELQNHLEKCEKNFLNEKEEIIRQHTERKNSLLIELKNLENFHNENYKNQKIEFEKLIFEKSKIEHDLLKKQKDRVNYLTEEIKNANFEIQKLQRQINLSEVRHEEEIKNLFLERDNKNQLFAKKEKDFLSQLDAVEDDVKEQKKLLNDSEIEFNAHISEYSEEIERLKKIIFHQKNKILSKKQGFWRRFFSPLKSAHYEIVDQSIFQRLATASNKIPQNTGAAQIMQLISKINYQPKFEIKSDGNYELNDFQSLYDKNFIRSAYISILRREPDPDGEKYYLNRIRTGTSKSTVLNQMLKSAEAKKYNTTISGLSASIFLEKICATPVLGTILSAVIFLLNTKNHLQDLRAFENHVIRMAEETQALHQENIEKLIANSSSKRI